MRVIMLAPKIYTIAGRLPAMVVGFCNAGDGDELEFLLLSLINRPQQGSVPLVSITKVS